MLERMIKAIYNAFGIQKVSGASQANREELAVYSSCLGQADRWCEYHGEDH